LLSFLTTSFVSAARPLRDATGRAATSRARTSPRRTRRQARTVQLVGGLVLVGTGVALLVRADLGVASWDVLHVALADRLGTSIGVSAFGIGVAATGLAWALRERPRPGTLVPLLIAAPTVDLVLGIVETPGTLAGQTAMLTAGTVLLAIGVGAYVASDHGAGPGDLVFLALAERGLSVTTARLIVDGTAVGAGWLLGGPVGIGTVLITVGLAPLVAATIRLFDLEPSRAHVGRLDREFHRAQALELHRELEGV
jgi:uncharacterized membrane protein YczE